MRFDAWWLVRLRDGLSGCFFSIAGLSILLVALAACSGSNSRPVEQSATSTTAASPTKSSYSHPPRLSDILDATATPTPLSPTPLSGPSPITTSGPPPTTGRESPPPTPAVGPVRAVAHGMSIVVLPGAAPAGGTVQIIAKDLNPRGRVNPLIFINLTGGPGGPRPLTPAPGSSLRLAPDGSLTGAFVVPPRAGVGHFQVCIAGQIGPSGADSVCAPFEVTAASTGGQTSNGLSTLGEPPSTPRASTGDRSAIAGHYQCSSMTLIGFGGGYCTGSEALIVINANGTYTWGREHGTYTFDGSHIVFSGQLGSGTILNRLLTVHSNVGGQTVIYRYLRMNY